MPSCARALHREGWPVPWRPLPQPTLTRARWPGPRRPLLLRPARGGRGPGRPTLRPRTQRSGFRHTSSADTPISRSTASPTLAGAWRNRAPRGGERGRRGGRRRGRPRRREPATHQAAHMLFASAARRPSPPVQPYAAEDFTRWRPRCRGPAPLCEATCWPRSLPGRRVRSVRGDGRERALAMRRGAAPSRALPAWWPP